MRWSFSCCESFQLLGSRFRPRQLARESMRPQLMAFPVIENIGRPVKSINAALIVESPGAENSSCNAATVILTAYRTSGFGWQASFGVCFQYTSDIEYTWHKSEAGGSSRDSVIYDSQNDSPSKIGNATLNRSMKLSGP